MVLSDLEQVKALAVPVRVEILHVLEHRPMTTTQIARLLKERPNKLYYHVTELERVGILEVAETRQRGNLVEKYFRPVARFFRIDPTLFQKGAEGQEAYLSTVVSNFDSTVIDLRRSMADGTLDQGLMQKAFSSVMEVGLSEERALALRQELRDLIVRYGRESENGGPVTVHLSTVFFMKRIPQER